MKKGKLQKQSKKVTPALRYVVRCVKGWPPGAFEWHEITVDINDIEEGKGYTAIIHSSYPIRYIWFDPKANYIVAGRSREPFIHESTQISQANTIDPKKFSMLWDLYLDRNKV